MKCCYSREKSAPTFVNRMLDDAHQYLKKGQPIVVLLQ